VAALRVWQFGDVTGGQHLGAGDPQLGKWRMVRSDYESVSVENEIFAMFVTRRN
jgi:hypothetical protein